jgi:integrase
LRALVYFEAYTGFRIEEALYLEWSDIDWETGTANINFKIDHDLKTQASDNPIGLPDVLIGVLRRWEGRKTCEWIFPNSRQRPWTGGPTGMKPLDQLKALARRAGVPHANWKMFRHTLTTHAKHWFGLSAEQVKAQLRHTTTRTQEIYTHGDRENFHGCVKDISFH